MTKFPYPPLGFTYIDAITGAYFSCAFNHENKIVTCFAPSLIFPIAARLANYASIRATRSVIFISDL